MDSPHNRIVTQRGSSMGQSSHDSGEEHRPKQPWPTPEEPKSEPTLNSCEEVGANWWWWHWKWVGGSARKHLPASGCSHKHVKSHSAGTPPEGNSSNIHRPMACSTDTCSPNCICKQLCLLRPWSTSRFGWGLLRLQRLAPFDYGTPDPFPPPP